MKYVYLLLARIWLKAPHASSDPYKNRVIETKSFAFMKGYVWYNFLVGCRNILQRLLLCWDSFDTHRVCISCKLPGIILVKATVLCPMKSRPIGSWSHTSKRTSAFCGIWILKTSVSSHIGLKPEWHERMIYRQSAGCVEILSCNMNFAHIPLSSTTLVCCSEQSMGRPIISTLTKGSIIWKQKNMSKNSIYWWVRCNVI